MVLNLGTLRPAYSRVYASIAALNSETETDILRDGDKYDYYIDGLLVNIDDLSTVGSSEVLIDFSIFAGDLEEKLLVNFPYSCRGTRANPSYIPLSKLETVDVMKLTMDKPLLPINKKFYYKVYNSDAAVAVTGTAVAIYAYPVYSR